MIRNFWAKKISDEEKDAGRLKAISPVNFAAKIVAPLLFIHCKDREIIPINQSKKMVSALGKAGRSPETLISRTIIVALGWRGRG